MAEHKDGFDGLTGLLNRRALDEHGRTLFSDEHPPRALLALFDIDHLKAINDRYGHAAGDEVVRVVAGRLKDAVGEVATVARAGGDEFAALFRDTSPTEAQALLRAACRVIKLPISGAGHDVTVSVSCGVASSATTTSWPDLLGRADDTLYDAKRLGGDRICFYRGDEPNVE